jgi:hypothetical protein
MVDRYPVNQTVVMRGFRNECDHAKLESFIRSILCPIDKVFITDDKYPVNAACAKLIFLNCSSPELAKKARSMAECNLYRFEEFKLVDFDSFQVYLKSTGAVFFSFALWLRDVSDEDKASLELKLRIFGSMTVPGLPAVKLLDRSSSAIVNYSRFDHAKAALDASQAESFILGNDHPILAVLVPQYNTRLVLRLIQHFRSSNTLVLSSSDAEDLARRVAADCNLPPAPWQAAVARCPRIFRIDTEFRVHFNPSYDDEDNSPPAGHVEFPSFPSPRISPPRNMTSTATAAGPRNGRPAPAAEAPSPPAGGGAARPPPDATGPEPTPTAAAAAAVVAAAAAAAIAAVQVPPAVAPAAPASVRGEISESTRDGGGGGDDDEDDNDEEIQAPSRSSSYNNIYIYIYT